MILDSVFFEGAFITGRIGNAHRYTDVEITIDGSSSNSSFGRL